MNVCEQPYVWARMSSEKEAQRVDVLDLHKENVRFHLELRIAAQSILSAYRFWQRRQVGRTAAVRGVELEEEGGADWNGGEAAKYDAYGGDHHHHTWRGRGRTVAGDFRWDFFVHIVSVNDLCADTYYTSETQTLPLGSTIVYRKMPLHLVASHVHQPPPQPPPTKLLATQPSVFIPYFFHLLWTMQNQRQQKQQQQQQQQRFGPTGGGLEGMLIMRPSGCAAPAFEPSHQQQRTSKRQHQPQQQQLQRHPLSAASVNPHGGNDMLGFDVAITMASLPHHGDFQARYAKYLDTVAALSADGREGGPPRHWAVQWRQNGCPQNAGQQHQRQQQRQQTDSAETFHSRGEPEHHKAGAFHSVGAAAGVRRLLPTGIPRSELRLAMTDEEKERAYLTRDGHLVVRKTDITIHVARRKRQAEA